MGAERMDRRPYPFEKKDKEEREKRSYPFEDGYENDSSAERYIKNGRVMQKGKGRRDGNAAISIVKGSGKERNRGLRKGLADRRPARGQHERTHAPKENMLKHEQGHREDMSEPITLRVISNTDIGTFLELDSERKVLLPFSEQTRKPEEGELISIRLFSDKGGRLTATMRSPLLCEGELGLLRVTDVTGIGAFLDNGMPKEVLLPFREQVCSPSRGEEVLVYIYRDKSGRMAATMRIYKYLSSASNYKEGDWVKGFVYEVNEKLGVFVAVDNRYFGLIPRSEVYKKYSYGDRVELRVTKLRPDGKLDLSPREKAYASIDQDADVVLSRIREAGGLLPYGDRAPAELIEKEYGMSKNQFKRALGNLYRRRLIEIDREKDTVRLLT